MSRRSHNLNKAKACADAAKEAHDPRERVELLQLSQRFILLADHAARCQEHGDRLSPPVRIPFQIESASSTRYTLARPPDAKLLRDGSGTEALRFHLAGLPDEPSD